jgi:hypothetical protein
VAKHQGADWHLDLKPVTLPQSASAALPVAENGARHIEQPSNDAALLKSLSAITTAVTELRRAVEAIGQRIDGLEGTVASQTAATQALAGQLASRPVASPAAAVEPPPPAPTRTRPVRPTSRTLRDSTTAPLERRSRRAVSAPAAERDDAPSQ